LPRVDAVELLVAVVGEYDAPVVHGKGAAAVLVDAGTHGKGSGNDILGDLGDVSALSHERQAAVFCGSAFDPVDVFTVERDSAEAHAAIGHAIGAK